MTKSVSIFSELHKFKQDNPDVEEAMLQLIATHEIMQTYKETMRIMREAEIALYERQEQQS